MNRHKFWQFTRTTSWRLSLFFSSAVLLICVSIIVVVYYFSLGEQEKYLQQQLKTVGQLFADLSYSQSLTDAQFIKAVQQRSRSSHSLLLALDHSSRPIGDLDRIPENLSSFPKTDTFVVAVRGSDGDLQPETVLGTRVQTAFGGLVVGVFYGQQTQLKERFLNVSATVIGVSLLLSLLLGLFFSHRTMAKVRIMTKQLDVVKSGKLQTRLSVSGPRDEYILLAEKINAMLEEIDSLINSLRAVTDNIAHDLRTPLSRIRMRIDNYLQPLNENDRNYQQLQPLLIEVDHVVDTFNAMLELSRLEHGAMQTQLQHCDLAHISEDVAALIAPIAEDKLQFDMQIKSGNNSIEGDPHLLFRAIYNVLDNAIRYTPAGGHVTLSVRETSVCVSDNGPGIAKADREFVFQRLARLDESRHDSDGYGLGLPIVRAIMNLHQGSITLSDNSPGLKVRLDF